MNATEVNSSLAFPTTTVAVDLERGSSQALYAADSASLSITGNMTLECWMKPESVPSGASSTHTLLAKYTGADQRSFIFALATDGSSNLGIALTLSSDGAATTFKHQTHAFSPGTWYHVAVVYTAASGEAEFFVDGASVGTSTGLPTSIFNGTADLEIGCFNTRTSEFFDGVIDEVRIWNTIRTSTEIDNNRNTHLLGSESGLAAYWPFEVPAGVGGFMYMSV